MVLPTWTSVQETGDIYVAWWLTGARVAVAQNQLRACNEQSAMAVIGEERRRSHQWITSADLIWVAVWLFRCLFDYGASSRDRVDSYLHKLLLGRCLIVVPSALQQPLPANRNCRGSIGMDVQRRLLHLLRVRGLARSEVRRLFYRCGRLLRNWLLKSTLSPSNSVSEWFNRALNEQVIYG
jgi:hypothetical protein